MIGPTDPRDVVTSFPHKVFPVRVTGGREYAVRILGITNSTYRFEDANGTPVARAGYTARFPRDGTYYLVVWSIDASRPIKVFIAVDPIQVVGPGGLTIEGELTTSDRASDSGTMPSKEVPVKLSIGKKYVAEVTGTGFAPTLRLRMPSPFHGKNESDGNPGKADRAVVRVAPRGQSSQAWPYFIIGSAEAKCGRFVLKVQEE